MSFNIQHLKINQCIITYHIKVKKKNHMVISTDAEKVFDKIQHLFIMKTHSKLGIEWNFLNLIKTTYKKPIANITLNGEKLKAFPLRSGTMQRCPFSPFLFNKARKRL